MVEGERVLGGEQQAGEYSDWGGVREGLAGEVTQASRGVRTGWKGVKSGP